MCPHTTYWYVCVLILGYTQATIEDEGDAVTWNTSDPDMSRIVWRRGWVKSKSKVSESNSKSESKVSNCNSESKVSESKVRESKASESNSNSKVKSAAGQQQEVLSRRFS
jgi:hypothetical protein